MGVTAQDSATGKASPFTKQTNAYGRGRARAFTQLNVSQDGWRALTGLTLYRWLIALILTAAQLGNYGTSVLGVSKPALFTTGCFALLALAALTALGLVRRWPPLTWQFYIHITGDLALITLLVYAAGGVTSGLAILLILPIAAAGVLRARREALLVAALASIAVLGEETARGLNTTLPLSNYTQAGILGGLFFLTVLSASLLEERIRESEDLAERRGTHLANLTQINERIIQRMQAGVLVVTRHGEMRLLNQAARTLLELSGRESAPLLEQTAPDLARSLRHWRDNPGHEPETLSRHRDPPLLPHYTKLGPEVGSPVLILLDDASRIDYQAQQMKLAALGRLSASIAHEIRNPLGAINHAAQLLTEADAVPDSERRLLDILNRQTTRINQVVENVLQLSRRERALTQPLQLRSWLRNTMAEFTGSEGTHNLRFEDTRVDGHLTVEADPQQLHQVVCNLWDNSLKHGQDNAEVVIMLSTGRHSNGRPWLDIADNGPGISADKAERIFEPFFTGASRGTGLGLYLAQELCVSNGAHLQCLPHADGARFRIIFSRDHTQGETA